VVGDNSVVVDDRITEHRAADLRVSSSRRRIGVRSRYCPPALSPARNDPRGELPACAALARAPI